MATYRFTNTSANGVSLKLTERPVYGSSRLGSLRKGMELYDEAFDPQAADPMLQVDLNYELTDHLGNVCAVVTGRLLDGNGGGTPKQADLLSAQGYEAFGSLLPGRNYSSGSYRFGFNGQERDDEILGSSGSSYAFEFRLHDSRVGRFWSVDPVIVDFPFYSPYQFAGNSPVLSMDIEGLQGNNLLNAVECPKFAEKGPGFRFPIRINLVQSSVTIVKAPDVQTMSSAAWNRFMARTFSITASGTLQFDARTVADGLSVIGPSGQIFNNQLIRGRVTVPLANAGTYQLTVTPNTDPTDVDPATGGPADTWYRVTITDNNQDIKRKEKIKLGPLTLKKTIYEQSVDRTTGNGSRTTVSEKLFGLIRINKYEDGRNIDNGGSGRRRAPSRTVQRITF